MDNLGLSDVTDVMDDYWDDVLNTKKRKNIENRGVYGRGDGMSGRSSYDVEEKSSI